MRYMNLHFTYLLTYQQASSQARTDSAWRQPVWLLHSSLGFQCPVGRRSYRLTPQATIAGRVIVACTCDFLTVVTSSILYQPAVISESSYLLKN